jgi:hypothetical protein
MQEVIQRFSEHLFWDVDRAGLDPERHAAYIVGRVLDYGKWEDWQSIRDHYGLERVKENALGLRTMFPKALAFIATVTSTSEKEFRCYKQLHSPDRLWHF